MDEEGHVLDGHHRVRACQELAIANSPSLVRVGLNEDQKLAHALALNLVRWHLTTAQRRALGLKLRQRGWSSPALPSGWG
jgi:ParB-like chromosome segregation protein Spo0J